jgi:hypothetical protein
MSFSSLGLSYVLRDVFPTDLFSFAYEGLNLEQLLSDPMVDRVSTLLDEVSSPSIPPIFYAHSRD